LGPPLAPPPPPLRPRPSPLAPARRPHGAPAPWSGEGPAGARPLGCTRQAKLTFPVQLSSRSSPSGPEFIAPARRRNRRRRVFKTPPRMLAEQDISVLHASRTACCPAPPASRPDGAAALAPGPRLWDLEPDTGLTGETCNQHAGPPRSALRTGSTACKDDSQWTNSPPGSKLLCGATRQRVIRAKPIGRKSFTRGCNCWSHNTENRRSPRRLMRKCPTGRGRLSPSTDARAQAVTALILRRAIVSRISGHWQDEDYDVFDGDREVGRIYLVDA
jgi:hypothetical protein